MTLLGINKSGLETSSYLLLRTRSNKYALEKRAGCKTIAWNSKSSLLSVRHRSLFLKLFFHLSYNMRWRLSMSRILARRFAYGFYNLPIKDVEQEFMNTLQNIYIMNNVSIEHLYLTDVRQTSVGFWGTWERFPALVKKLRPSLTLLSAIRIISCQIH